MRDQGAFRAGDAPLAPMAVFFAAGIIAAGGLARLSVFFLMALASASAAAGLFGFSGPGRRPAGEGRRGVRLTRAPASRRGLPPGTAVSLAALAFVAGALRMLAAGVPADFAAADDFGAGTATAAAGTVCGVPASTHRGWRFSLCPHTGGPPIRVEWRGAGPPGPESHPPASYGDEVAVRGRLARPAAPGNPWGFHAPRYWRARHLPEVLYASGPGTVERLEGPRPPSEAGTGGLRRGFSLRAAAARMPVTKGLMKGRERARAALARAMGGPEWELAAALIFGDGGEVSDDVRGRFQRSGLAHLLAVSGLHIGLLAWMAQGILQPVVYRRGARYAVMLLVLAAAVLWTGGRAPVVRVAVAFAIGGGLMASHRPPSPLHALGGAFLALLIYHPYQLWDTGFQLTFSAAAAVTLMGGPAVDALMRAMAGDAPAGDPVAEALMGEPASGTVSTLFRTGGPSPRGRDGGLPPFPPQAVPRLRTETGATPGLLGTETIPRFFRIRVISRPLPAETMPRLLGGWRSRLAGAVGVGAAAFLGTVPVIAGTFGQIQPLSIVTTPLALPIVTLFLAAGMAAVPLVAAVPGAAPLVAPLLKVPGRLLHRLADFSAAAGPWHVPAPPPWLAALYWIILIFCLADGRPPIRRRHRPRPLPVSRLAIAAAGVAAFFVWTSILAVPRHLEVVFADVGQGDGIIIGAPPGLWMVVDGGGVGGTAARNAGGGSGGTPPAIDPSAVPGAAYGISPFLTRRGVNRLDVVLMTHAHADHGSGLAYVLSERPGAAGAFVEPGFPGTGRWYEDLEAVLYERQVPRVAPRAGDRMPFGAGEIRFLGPPPGYLRGTADDVNNSSLVFRLDYGGLKMLFTGDIEEEAEKWLVTRYGGGDLSAHVLKVPHHGSGTSSSPPFLDEVGAGIAVIQSGAGNPYGHPGPETIRSLIGSGAAVLRNDVDGAIIIKSNGRTVCMRLGRAGGELCRPIEQMKR